ncbi:hypothetical protein P8452_76168 [Trifolium repens]|nr:hypothetical protein P8452_76168 [Trifolium repens]
MLMFNCLYYYGRLKRGKEVREYGRFCNLSIRGRTRSLSFVAVLITSSCCAIKTLSSLRRMASNNDECGSSWKKKTKHVNFRVKKTEKRALNPQHPFRKGRVGYARLEDNMVKEMGEKIIPRVDLIINW